MLEEALNALRKGKFVIIYDGGKREGECDLVMHARFASPRDIEILRKNAGGLICLATGGEVAKALRLPFMSDLLLSSPALSGISCRKTPYGDKPAFSIAVNHRRTYTGITDADRSLTIREFARVVEKGNGARKEFLRNFYSPGHVHLLIGRGLGERRGHTELALVLASLARMPPVMVVCEMLGKGKALPFKEALSYAKENGIPIIKGKDIYESWSC